MARERSLLPCPDSSASAGPVRTCVGCRQRVAQHELLRVTAGSDVHGLPAITPDPRGTAPGRGAYIHPTHECFDLAVRRKAFARALRLPPNARAGRSAAEVANHLGSPEIHP